MKDKILIFKIINIRYNFYRILINCTHQTLNMNSIHLYANKCMYDIPILCVVGKYRVLFVRFYFLINSENILIITIQVYTFKRM